MYARNTEKNVHRRNAFGQLCKQISIPAISAAFLFFFIFTFSLIPAFTASTQQMELMPKHDAYIANDLNDPTDRAGLRNLNTGDFEFMKVWYAWNVTQSGKEKLVSLGYMKYDLSDIDAKFVEKAEMKMYANILNLTGAARAVDLHLVSSEEWDEQTITYGTAPAFMPEANSTTFVSKPGQYYTWDVTELVKEKAGSELPLVITLRTLYQNSEEQVVFNTKEATDGSKAPKLLIDYSGPISTTEIPDREAVSMGEGGHGSEGDDATNMIVYGSIGGAAAAGGFAFFMYNKQRNGHFPTIPIVRKQVSASEAKEMKFCFNCAKEIKQDYNACPYCGTNLRSNLQ